jgi:hypothetical protein
VEAAFVLPIMLILMLAMMHIGLVILGNSTGSNAARDGARVGIVNYMFADVEGDADHQAIVDAVERRLARNVDDGSIDVDVRCLSGLDNSVKTCAVAIPDTDLLEVTVTWQDIGITPFVGNSTHSESARLVIVGEVNLEEGPTPPISFTASSPSVVEGDVGDNRSLSFIVTRSFNTTNVTVSYTAIAFGSSPATSGVDFEATTGTINFTAGGASSATVIVPIIEDDAIESNETLRLQLSAPAPSSVNHGTGTITNDDVDETPPVLQNVQIRDDDGDGKLDRLVAVFDEPLGCPGTWTFSQAAGGSVSNAVVNGSTVDVFLTEGGGFNTAPGGVTVTGSGTCDAAGNPAGSMTNPTLVDLAVPRLVGVAPTTPGRSPNGTVQSGDQIQFTMSEAITGVPTSLSVVVTGGNGNPGYDTYAVGSITTGSLEHTGYISGNRVATFANSNVSNVGGLITVTLGPACTGNQACSNSTTANSTGGGAAPITATPATTLIDTSNNAAAGTFTANPAIALF